MHNRIQPFHKLTQNLIRRAAISLIVVAVVGTALFGFSYGNQTLSGSPRTAAAAPIINEYLTTGINPDNITTGPDGNLWFTDSHFLSNDVDKITPHGVVTGYVLPTDYAETRGIATGSDGNVWFTEYDRNQIGKITPGGTVTEYVSGNKPEFMSAGPDGNVWFTEEGQADVKIAKITPGGIITAYSMSMIEPGITIDQSGITSGPDGNLWFANSYDCEIGNITPSGLITEYSKSTSNICPGGIIAGPDGNLWFTEPSNHSIDKISTTGNITKYPIGVANTNPNRITAGPDGNLWFTDLGTNSIGRITTSGTVTEYTTPTVNSQPDGITTGPDGNIWFTENNTQTNTNKIGQLILALDTSITVTSLSDSGGSCPGSNCTLRAAIASATSRNSGTTINFGLSGTITVGSTLQISNSSANPINIDGSGQSLIIDAHNMASIFTVNSSAVINVNALTIQHGTGNTGGGINNSGRMNISNVTLYGNNSSDGAAIYNSSSGTMSISNGTIAGNNGINAGGVENKGAITISNSTISGNGSAFAGGVYNAGTLRLFSTIVAANFDHVSSSGDIVGTVISLGHNIIGDNTSLTGPVNGTNGDQIGTRSAPINPRLSSLASNGGATQTMTLLSGSPAIGSGVCSGNSGVIPPAPSVTVDQRGVSRGSPCDVGAYEGVSVGNIGCAGVTQIPADECNFLVALYTATNGTNWTANSGWNTNTPCTTPWFGVSCDATNSNVTSLNLYQNNLVGTLPSTLNALTQLQILSFGKNTLSGPIPSWTGLTHLTFINTDYTQLSGQIPSLNGLVNLKSISLLHNQLSGLIPALNGLVNLQFLNFSENQLSGSVPDLTGLSSLQTLELYNDGLNGSIPPFSDLPNLQYFGVFNNQLTGTIPALNNLPNLQTFSVSSNQLSGNLPDVPPSLTYLSIANNLLNGVIPDSLRFTAIPITPLSLYLCGTNTLTPADDQVNQFIAARIPNWTGHCGSPSDTIGIYRAGTFYLRNQNTTGFANITVAYNPATQPYPIVGDWTGGGIDTIGVYDQSNGQFLLRNSNTPGAPDETFGLGIANDQPLSGRWQAGATHSGVGVFRPSNGLIYLKNDLSTGFADYTMVLGIPGDVGVAGDWNSKGYDSPGAYRPSTTKFYLSNQVTNGGVFGDYEVQLGIPGDVPIVGDWIGQGHDGVGVFRVSNGLIYMKDALTTGYANRDMVYGIANDIPVAGHWSNSAAASIATAANLIVANTPSASTALPTAAPPTIRVTGQPNYDG